MKNGKYFTPNYSNERKVLDKKHYRILKKPIRCLIADAGYRDKKCITAMAAAKIMLITPDVSVKQAEAMLDSMNAMAVAVFNEAKASRKTVIESTFDLLSKLLGPKVSRNLYSSAGCHTSPPFSDLVF